MAVNESKGDAVAFGSSVGMRVGMSVGISVEMIVKANVGVGMEGTACKDVSMGVDVDANSAENGEQAERRIASAKSVMMRWFFIELSLSNSQEKLNGLSCAKSGRH